MTLFFDQNKSQFKFLLMGHLDVYKAEILTLVYQYRDPLYWLCVGNFLLRNTGLYFAALYIQSLLNTKPAWYNLQNKSKFLLKSDYFGIFLLGNFEVSWKFQNRQSNFNGFWWIYMGGWLKNPLNRSKPSVQDLITLSPFCSSDSNTCSSLLLLVSYR